MEIGRRCSGELSWKISLVQYMYQYWSPGRLSVDDRGIGTALHRGALRQCNLQWVGMDLGVSSWSGRNGICVGAGLGLGTAAETKVVSTRLGEPAPPLQPTSKQTRAKEPRTRSTARNLTRVKTVSNYVEMLSAKNLPIWNGCAQWPEFAANSPGKPVRQSRKLTISHLLKVGYREIPCTSCDIPCGMDEICEFWAESAEIGNCRSQQKNSLPNSRAAANLPLFDSTTRGLIFGHAKVQCAPDRRGMMTDLRRFCS